MKSQYYCFYDSPIGPLILEANAQALLFLHLLPASFDRSNKIEKVDLSLFIKARSWLDAYFDQKPLPFDLPYSLEDLSYFQQEVLDLVSQIPYGHTCTYKEIAQRIASSRNRKTMSCQAVGQALSKNPLPLFIPCHRIIGVKNLGGYQGGIECKRFLLHLEDALNQA